MNVAERFAWMDLAPCASTDDPDLWFDSNRRAEAKRICAACPVADRCGTRGEDINAYRGVWGGESRAPHNPGLSTTAPYLEYPHGTPERYRQHVRDGQPPCGRCQIANTFDKREYRAQAEKEVSA